MYLKCIENNAEICFTSRINRKNDSLVHRIFSPLFYKLVSSATKGKTIYQSADFRLISKHVLETINGLPEVNKMFRVLIPNLGFKAVVIEYEREMRIGGSSKYNFRSLFKLGTKSMLATTGAPLRWVSIASLIGAIIALVLSGIALVQGFFLQSVPGWASISFIISVMFFFQSITSLVVSEFLLILLADVRKRPTYQVLK
jgi:dolichol-phosphate mannosyltransferase